MVDQTVIAWIRSREFIETAARPVELAAVNDCTAYTCAVAADELGQRVANDVGAMLNWSEEERCRYCIVNNERQAVVMRDTCNSFKIIDIVLGVADRFGKNCLGVLVDGLSDVLRVAAVDKLDVDPHALQGVVEHVVSPAIEILGRDDIVAGLGKVKDSKIDCCRSRCHHQCTDAAIKLSQTFFKNIGGRVHQTGIDVAHLGEREEVCSMLA